LGILKALTYIQSDEDLLAEVNASSRIFKLSGRYELTDKFDIKAFDNKKTKNKYVFKKRQASWISESDTGVDFMLQTRLWSFTPALLDDTINMYSQIVNNMFATFNAGKYIDNEHSMAKFIPADKLVELDVVGLQGNIAPNGMMVID